MCLGIPMRLSSIENNLMATAETMGVKRTISIQMVPGARVGDHVLVHAGFAIERIDPAEAAERIELLKTLLEEPV
ncbi:MAG: HypC/HybG/HupF family hydrogenase formation chaperone [Bacillota bacterium]